MTPSSMFHPSAGYGQRNPAQLFSSTRVYNQVVKRLATKPGRQPVAFGKHDTLAHAKVYSLEHALKTYDPAKRIREQIQVMAGKGMVHADPWLRMADVWMGNLVCATCRGKLKEWCKGPDDGEPYQRECQSCWGTGMEAVKPETIIKGATDACSYLHAKRRPEDGKGATENAISQIQIVINPVRAGGSSPIIIEGCASNEVLMDRKEDGHGD